MEGSVVQPASLTFSSRPAGDRLADSTLHLLSHVNHAPAVTSNPDMEPIKVQSEGGLNVTLTIRLLMHGKVGEPASRL